MAHVVWLINNIYRILKSIYRQTLLFLLADIYLGRCMANVPDGSILISPLRKNILCCGLAGIVTFKKREKKDSCVDVVLLDEMVKKIETSGRDGHNQADDVFHQKSGHELPVASPCHFDNALPYAWITAAQ